MTEKEAIQLAIAALECEIDRIHLRRVKNEVSILEPIVCEEAIEILQKLMEDQDAR